MVNPINETSTISERQQEILEVIMRTEDCTIFLGLLKLKIQEPVDDLIDDLNMLETQGLLILDPPTSLVKESPDLLCRFRLTNTGQKYLIERLNQFAQNHPNSRRNTC